MNNLTTGQVYNAVITKFAFAVFAFITSIIITISKMCCASTPAEEEAVPLQPHAAKRVCIRVPTNASNVNNPNLDVPPPE